MVVTDSGNALLGTFGSGQSASLTDIYDYSLAVGCSFVQTCSNKTTKTDGTTERLLGQDCPILNKYWLTQRLNGKWSHLTEGNGERKRQVEICTGMAVWYHTAKPVVPIRWVLVRDPQGKFKSQALLCTNQAYSPTQILEWFVRRSADVSYL